MGFVREGEFSLIPTDRPERTPESFPTTRTTYLPFGFSRAAHDRFGIGLYDTLHEELRQRDAATFERVGVDRALAIACDLALAGMRRSASILDVGCSTGLIARMLADVGYQVKGIDSEVVAEVQDWQDRETIRRARSSLETPRCRFFTGDAVSFLESNNERYDVILLLSVLHHFLDGYGYSSAGSFSPERFDHFLRLLCSRATSYIYVEVPGPDEHEEMPPDPSGRFVFPLYFLEARIATDVHLIASTVATNGKPRRLYRVDLA